MADRVSTEVEEQEGAPAAPSSPASDHSEGLTRGEIEELLEGHGLRVAEQVRNLLTENYRNVQSLIDKSAARIASEHGISRADALLLKQMAQEQLGEERVTEVEARAQREEEAAAAARDAAAAASERDALKEILGKQDGGEAAVWDTTLTLIFEAGVEEGLDEETVKRLMPKNRVAGSGDPFGYKGLYREWRKALRAESLKNQREAEPEVVTPGTTGGGTGDPLAAYRKALAEGGPLPSRSEIDRLTAKYR